MALLRTPLHGRHVAAGAILVEFVGWEMPIQYTSIVKEHLAVRSAVGLFDVSHMGELFITGPGAADFISHVTTGDMQRMAPGRCRYCHLLDEQGHIIDDTIVSRLEEDVFLLVPNAATTARVRDWLTRHLVDFDATLTDRTADFVCLALQGPRAPALLASELDITIAPFTVARHGDLVVSGTGYTGEPGCELFVPAHRAGEVWDRLVAAGAAPVGLGARDTLRLEKGYLLSGQDFDGSQTTLETGYGWVVDWEHDFIGLKALAAQRGGDYARLRGVMLEDRGVPRPGCPVLIDGVSAGSLTSGTLSPTLKRGIGLAYLAAGPGTGVAVEVRGKPLRGRIVRLPFLKGGSS